MTHFALGVHAKDTCSGEQVLEEPGHAGAWRVSLHCLNETLRQA